MCGAWFGTPWGPALAVGEPLLLIRSALKLTPRLDAPAPAPGLFFGPGTGSQFAVQFATCACIRGHATETNSRVYDLVWQDHSNLATRGGTRREKCHGTTESTAISNRSITRPASRSAMPSANGCSRASARNPELSPRSARTGRMNCAGDDDRPICGRSEGRFSSTNGLRLPAAPVTTPHAFNHRYFGPHCRAASDRRQHRTDRAGARVGFVGRNGVGKSTLFHAIRGDLPTESGSITHSAALAHRQPGAGSAGRAGKPRSTSC